MISSQAHRPLSQVCFSILILIYGNNVYGIDDIELRVHANNFLLKQKDTEQCLILMNELEGCFPESGEIIDGCFNSNKVVFDECNEGIPEQRWVFDFQNKRIHSLERRAEVCLTRLPEKLSMEYCKPTHLKQLWFFNQQDEFFSRVDFLDPLAFVKLLEGDTDAPLPVTFNFIDSETGNDQCYLSPFTGRVECSKYEIDEEVLKQQEVEFWNWSGSWPWQPTQVKVTEDLKLGELSSNRCLAVDQCHIDSVGQYDCFGGAKLQVKACKPESHQVWRYDLVSKRLFNKQAGEQFCVSWLSGKLSLEHCLPGGAISQKWYFARGEGRKYSERGRLRWFSNSREHYDYIKSLDFDPIVKFEILNKDSQGKGCGYDPIDGLWKGLCSN